MPWRLEDDALGVLALDWDVGYGVVEFDPGYPRPVEVVDPREDSGTDDYTTQHGARAVALRVAIIDDEWGSRRPLLDALRAYMHPARRPQLIWSDQGGDERRLVVRAAGLGGGLITSPTRVDVVCQWVAPSGLMEEVDERGAVVRPGTQNFATGGVTGPSVYGAGTYGTGTYGSRAGVGVIAQPGRVYTHPYPRAYPDGIALSTLQLTVLGDTPVAPRLLIYGPCTNPKVELEQTGQRLELTANGGLVLVAGEYIEIDCSARTVLAGSDPAASRYDRVDFTLSPWFRLQPGVNTIRFVPEAWSSGAAVELRWRGAWI